MMTDGLDPGKNPSSTQSSIGIREFGNSVELDF